MRPPNVVLVLTDDQGYGDLGCTGNPWLQTPHLDAFHAESVRLRHFHAQPLCTPTRGALMTGRRPIRNGAWATCWGRSILRREETTLAELLAAKGYATGLFGKWHLGDNYPYRPQDRGFQRVVAHKGGGVGSSPDFWGNNYFDDTYFHNGRPVAHAGYCTDVWFDTAWDFIRTHREQPFFAYIATNAPHDPWLVADEYRQRYEGEPGVLHPAFYGMISNIDDNFGRLRQRLGDAGLADDTILIFMTDNGTSGGCRARERNGPIVAGYNAGMRGMKASLYDGGHRVPCFVRWPGGRLAHGRDVDELTAVTDVLPTLLDLCGLDVPVGLELDGRSLARQLRGEAGTDLGERCEFIQFRQHTNPPDPWDNAVLAGPWRLVRGAELYDIQRDPGQSHDLAAEHPDVVERLRAEHERWWARVAPRLDELAPITLGHEAENPTCLDAMDVLGDVAWSQSMIVMAQKHTGRWRVQVDQPGRYRFALRRWPEQLSLAIDEALPAADAAKIAPYQRIDECRAIHPCRARLRLFGADHILPVRTGDREVVFDLAVPKSGVTDLEAWFADANGEERGAYYVVVKREDARPRSPSPAPLKS